MRFPRLQLDSACRHVAVACADAPAWGAVLVLLLAPLPMGSTLPDGVGAPLASGLAAVGTALLARRMSGTPRAGASAPNRAPDGAPNGAAAGSPRVFTLPRFVAFVVALALSEAALVLVGFGGISYEGDFVRSNHLTLAVHLLAGVTCGAFPRPGIVVTAVLSVVGRVAADWQSVADERVISTAAWRSVWPRGDEELIVRACGALALLAAVVPVRRVLIVTVIGVAVGYVFSDAYVHVGSLAASAAAFCLPTLALAAVAGRLAGDLPAGDGTVQVAIRAHPWITSICLLAWSWEVASAAESVGWLGPANRVAQGLIVVAVAFASALGTRRAGDLYGRLPGVLALQPVVVRSYEWLVPMSRSALALLPGVATLGMSCAAAWAPFRPATRPVAVAAGVAAHFLVALAVATDGDVEAALWMLLVALPLAVLLTPWDARVALCGAAAAWAVANGLRPDAEPRVVAGSAVAGVLVGAVCHVANRLRAVTPVPRDHPVFTEGPFVTAPRAAVS